MFRFDCPEDHVSVKRASGKSGFKRGFVLYRRYITEPAINIRSKTTAIADRAFLDDGSNLMDGLIEVTLQPILAHTINDRSGRSFLVIFGIEGCADVNCCTPAFFTFA